MRRVHLTLLISTVVSLLVLSSGWASAQTSPRVERLEAIVTGETDPDEDPDGHALGVNRVAGESEFDGLVIDGELECDDGEIVEFSVTGPMVRFDTDDDLTDGFGEIHGTDDGFRDDAATAIRAGGLPNEVLVEIRILGGRFHRVLNYIDVDLRLDIRVVDNPGQPDEEEICEDPEHEIRILFLIVGPGPDGDGFSLVGVARTHELPEDRTSVARLVCENFPGPWHDALRTVDSLNGGRQIEAFEPLARIEISEDHRGIRIEPTSVPPGRGPLEPCKPHNN